LGRYDYEDVGFTDQGDFVVDTDPLDSGADVGWDFLLTSKMSRNSRRLEMMVTGSHPGEEYGTLKEFYMQALREIYPGATDQDLENTMKDWGYIKQDRYEALRQIIMERIKTTNEDWQPYPTVGADLEVSIGEDITRDYLEEMRDRVVRCLLYDNLVETGDVMVRYYSGGHKIVILVVEVLVDDKNIIREVIPFSFVDGPFVLMKEGAMT